MSDAVEVIIASDASGQHWSIGVWDIRNGSQLMTYKGGGSCGSKALSLVGNDYIVAGESSKPLLHVWPVNKGDPLQDLRSVCAGLIGCLAVSPDGRYLVAGISEKLYVWQVESGKLMAVAARHFQNVTCVRFMDDGSHFVSGGDDALVLVWSLSHVIAADSAQPDPVHSYSDHFLGVKDLYVGPGGDKCRIVSVSLDGTCKVYDFSSGKTLLSIMVEPNLTAVVADVCESLLFVGTNAGDILTLDLRAPPRQQEHHLSEKEKEVVFRGHSKAITCLSVSQDTTTLLSGSVDETVRLWHIDSRQCIRTIQLKGPVTNAFITFLPVQSFTQKLQPSIVMHRLQRNKDLADSGVNVEILVTSSIENNFDYGSNAFVADKHDSLDNTDHSFEIPRENSKELDNLKKKNAELFKFAAEKLLSQVNNYEIVSNHVDTNIALQDIEMKSVVPKPISLVRKRKNKNRNKKKGI